MLYLTTRESNHIGQFVSVTYIFSLYIDLPYILILYIIWNNLQLENL